MSYNLLAISYNNKTAHLVKAMSRSNHLSNRIASLIELNININQVNVSICLTTFWVVKQAKIKKIKIYIILNNHSTSYEINKSN